MNPISKALKRHKFFKECARVQKSESKWCYEIIKNVLVFYKGGVSGRFIAITELGLISFGDYDGALPTMADAVYWKAGLELVETKEAALRKVFHSMGSDFIKEVSIK